MLGNELRDAPAEGYFVHANQEESISAGGQMPDAAASENEIFVYVEIRRRLLRENQTENAVMDTLYYTTT